MSCKKCGARVMYSDFCPSCEDELEAIGTRDAVITRLRAENEELKRDKWKANHDEMVRRNAELRDRPDLKERAALVDQLRAERDKAVEDARVLAKEVESLARRMFISMDYDRWQDAASGAALEALTRHTGGQDNG